MPDVIALHDVADIIALHDDFLFMFLVVVMLLKSFSCFCNLQKAYRLSCYLHFFTMQSFKENAIKY